MECIHTYYIHNYKLIECYKFKNAGFRKGVSIYEVIRIEKGIPLFLENHLNRLYNSASLSKMDIEESYCDFEELIDKLIKKNGVAEGKIKLVIHYNSKQKDILLYFTPHYFPTSEEYRNGVIAGVCKSVRANPNAKILNTKTRKLADRLIAKRNLFEVLLLDKHNCITEGSRSNVFFIKGNKMITPPETDVLMGIARSNIIEICKSNNIGLVKEKVPYAELKNMDSVFLSGTSLKVLPVKQVENNMFDAGNRLLGHLLELYNHSIDNYLASKRH